MKGLIENVEEVRGTVLQFLCSLVLNESDGNYVHE